LSTIYASLSNDCFWPVVPFHIRCQRAAIEDLNECSAERSRIGAIGMETFDTAAQIVDNRSPAVSLPANRQPYPILKERKLHHVQTVETTGTGFKRRLAGF
jgi:hypothetical protein